MQPHRSGEETPRPSEGGGGAGLPREVLERDRRRFGCGAAGSRQRRRFGLERDQTGLTWGINLVALAFILGFVGLIFLLNVVEFRRLD